MESSHKYARGDWTCRLELNDENQCTIVVTFTLASCMLQVGGRLARLTACDDEMIKSVLNTEISGLFPYSSCHRLRRNNLSLPTPFCLRTPDLPSRSHTAVGDISFSSFTGAVVSGLVLCHRKKKTQQQHPMMWYD